MSNDSRSTIIEEPPLETPAGKATRRSGAAGTRTAEQERARLAADDAATRPGPPRSVWREYFESLVVTAIKKETIDLATGEYIGKPVDSYTTACV